jgi:hypothetical protein
MSNLALYGITSIEVAKESGLVTLRIRGKSMDGPSYFTVSLFGDEGLSIEMDEVLPIPGSVVELVEAANAA